MEPSPIKVLVVDDYEPWRQFVCTTLQKNSKWQVIGEASDGLEAVQQARELQPDLIVLDLGLPTFNGIEAARRIRELSPRSRILFLSENDSWDIAEEGLRTGAGGYVVKSDAGKDLLPAVIAVLEGKRYVSARLAGHDLADSSVAATPPQSKGQTGCHEVGFYSRDAALVDGFADFAEAALMVGNAVIVIATESHRIGLQAKLLSKGVDLGTAIAESRYVALDSADTLSMIMTEGEPDPSRFLELASRLIRAAAQSAKGDHPCVAICGECDPPLWTLGNGDLQLRVEQLWNAIAAGNQVNILCGYLIGDAQTAMEPELYQRICAEHSVVHSR